jgi:hypothetical protein
MIGYLWYDIKYFKFKKGGEAMSFRRINWKKELLSIYLIVMAVLFIFPISVGAHCDRVNGPVAKAAVSALETGSFDKIAIWVGPEQEKELKDRFQKSLEVYKSGDEVARQLAERYLMENTVRLHRSAEGFAYEGLKPAQPLPPDIAKAEEALETGNLEPVNELLKGEMKNQTGKWFQNALSESKDRDKGIKEGREWVDAYVKYIIYIHNLYETIQAGPPHGIHE